MPGKLQIEPDQLEVFKKRLQIREMKRWSVEERAVSSEHFALLIHCLVQCRCAVQLQFCNAIMLMIARLQCRHESDAPRCLLTDSMNYCVHWTDSGFNQRCSRRAVLSFKRDLQRDVRSRDEGAPPLFLSAYGTWMQALPLVGLQATA